MQTCEIQKASKIVQPSAHNHFGLCRRVLANVRRTTSAHNPCADPLHMPSYAARTTAHKLQHTTLRTTPHTTLRTTSPAQPTRWCAQGFFSM